jgi:hypothetical protein
VHEHPVIVLEAEEEVGFRRHVDCPHLYRGCPIIRLRG